MGKVQGKDVILYIDDNSGKCDQPIACARSIDFTYDNDYIDVTISGYGKFRNYVPGMATISANVDGLVALKGYSTKTVYGNLSSFHSGGDYGIIIDVADLCLPVGSLITVVVNGTTEVYTIVNYAPYLGGTLIIIDDTVIIPSGYGSLSWQVEQYDIEKMYNALINGSLVKFIYYEEDNEGNYFVKQFYGYFETITEVGSFDNMDTFTASIKGSGIPIFEFGQTGTIKPIQTEDGFDLETENNVTLYTEN
jgi:predicted secreted protein